MTSPENEKAKRIVYRSLTRVEGAYLVGNTSRHVTIYSQQCRALNLVWALFQLNKLNSDLNKVAVIGGGIAGLTAAAALSEKGCDVWIYEERDNFLHLQRGSAQRYVHPHIYDWPRPGSEDTEANLPFLTWRADFADRVISQLEAEWKTIARSRKFHIRHKEVAGLRRTSLGKVEISIGGGGIELDKFDAVIVAVGFGVDDRAVGSVNARPYWRNDDFNQETRGERSYLVSGCGDGGLIDTLKLRIHDFRHSEVADGLLQSPYIDSIKQQLLAIERDAKKHRPSDVSSFLYESYGKITELDTLKAGLLEKTRNNTSVVLNGKEASPLNLSTSILNRVLVFLLLEHDAARTSYLAGELDPIPAPREGGKYVVSHTSAQGAVHDQSWKRTVDAVILRHGPVEIPLVNSLKNTEDIKIEDDSERRPNWPHGFYPDAPALGRSTKKSIVVKFRGKILAAATVVMILLGATIIGWRARPWPKPVPPPIPSQPIVPDDKEISKTLGTKFVLIHAGKFTMGCPRSEIDQGDIAGGLADRFRQREVILTRDFYMATTDVTVGEFKKFVSDNPGFQTEAEKAGSASTWHSPGFALPQTDENPVVNVTWNDAVQFTAWLSGKEHRQYRLPLDAEWEYACRANSPVYQRFNVGDTLDLTQANVGQRAPNFIGTTPVKKYAPTSWGLYDMHGNVWQWCLNTYQDWPDGFLNYPGPGTFSDHVSLRELRGGSWTEAPDLARSSNRFADPPGNFHADRGFRIVYEVEK